jgi:cardiolipin synthase A/B
MMKFLNAKFFFLSFLLLFGLTISGCQTIPNTTKIIAVADKKDVGLEIRGVNQNLSQKKVGQIVDQLAGTDEEEALLEKQLKITQEIAKQALVSGNDTKLLFDGEQTFKAIFDLIKSAKNHINLEYFIFENIDFDGMSLDDLLINKLREGVSINVIYDGIGSFNTDNTFIDKLKAAGVRFTVYQPINLSDIDKINYRDHRKILIVDGKAAIVGGINLSKTYQSKGMSGSSGASKTPANAEEAYWRDTDLLIQGPVVSELQTLFLQHWDKTQLIDQKGFFPKQEVRGQEFVQVIGSSPKDDQHYFYTALIAAIDNSAKKIILSSAYFVPTQDHKKVLIDASMRGVKIDLILPGFTDSSLSLNVQRSYYEDLLEAGINIYEVDSEVLHAKTITIDGVWSVVGSSNFDFRSATLNDEVDMIVLGRKIANQLEQKFVKDKEKFKKIELNEWKRRPLLDKLKQYFSRMFDRML